MSPSTPKHGTIEAVMAHLRTLDDLPLDGKRVLVRVDFNVYVGDDGKVDSTEDFRLTAAVQTIQELQQRRCKVLLITHLGRPKNAADGMDMAPIKRRLEQLLGEDVRTIGELYGPGVQSVVDGMEPGQVALLPNVRLDHREETGNLRFAHELAHNGDMFVNEAFSVVHRAHASVAFLPQEIPSCAGRRTVLEVEQLSRLIDNIKKPYVALIGGAKITTKIGMIHDLLGKVDTLCVGGQLANIFIAALGHYPHKKFAVDDIAAAQYILERGASKLLLPIDLVVGDEEGKNLEVVDVDSIPPDADGLYDIGPKSLELFLRRLKEAKTIMWNGPIGKFEVEAYAKSSRAVARELATMSAYRVVGGGNTVNMLEEEKVIGKYDHVSVGGGAMIAFLEGKTLPGLMPLYD
ncbi:phosphoglycerate kinase [bacterium]|nr:phosphoglycerate kinase [bacterium]